MKLMASPTLNYTSPRLQASSASTARSPQAHTPQADAQRSGASNSLSSILTMCLMVGISGLYGFVGTKFSENDAFYEILTSSPNNCKISLSMVREYLGKLDPKKVPLRLKKEAEIEYDLVSGMFKDITKKCQPFIPRLN
ncbi:MAG: hypothetical protein ACK551_01595 [Vampirovibrionales bacterium]